MSNNIYDIMNKLNAVASKDSPQVKTESGGKTLLESTMKEVLNEKYMGFDKTVAAIKKGGSAKDPEAVAASINRKKYGEEKFQAAAAQGKKLGERKLSEKMPMGSVPAPELGPLSYKPADQTDDDSMDDVADIPMPGNKLSPKDQYQAIKKDVEKVQSGARYPIGSMNNLRKDSDVGRFAVPGYGDQGQFFQEDDMEEGNLFTGNLAKARAQGKKRADLDGDGDMETVREGAKPDYIDLGKDGNRKESMKKAAADKKKKDMSEQVEQLEENWSKGSSRSNTSDAIKATTYRKKAQDHLADAKRFEKDQPEHHDAMSKYHVAMAKSIKHAYHAGDYGSQSEAKSAFNKHMKLAKSQDVTEGTKETSTGRVHKADPGGYGRRDDDEDGDKKKTEPAVKRGRGRPKKDADSETGEVKKYGNAAALQSFMVGNLPKGKLPGKTTTKHKIKDEPDEKLDEKAPPGAKAERMVKHIKQGYAKDGKLTDKEKGIAYATAWKAKNAGKVEESIPPGFPRSLAKKIYEHFDGNVDSTLNAMWRVHNTIMEQNRSNVSEPPEFSMGAGVKPSRVRITQPEPEFDYGATGKAPKGPSIPPYRPTIDNAEMRQFNRRFKDVMSMPNYVGGHPEGEMGATGNPQNKVVLKKPLAIDTVPAMTVMPDRVPHIQNIPAPSKMSDGGLADKLRNIPGPGNFSGGGGGAKWKEKEDNVFESNTLGIFGKKTNEGRVQGGIWRDLPPKAGEKDVPAPYPDEGPTAPIKTAPVKKAPAAQPQMGTYKGGVWTADPPKPGQVGVPVPQDIDGGSAPAPKSKPVKTQKKAEVDVDGDTGIAEMLNLAGIKAAVTEADLSECGMSSSPISGAMNDDDGRMNISTNMSSDGNKTVTITADGEAAVELMKMLKMAGMNANMGHEDTDVETMSEEKDPRYEASTTPEEEVLPVQTQLKGGNGDVAGKEKKMTPHGYKFADNPLAMKESMSLKLIKEYEGIKKAV